MAAESLAARMRVLAGDITQQQADAIVNAANSGLRGGGGVDGAIHRAAGPELLEACRTFGGCPAGEVRTTPGFALPARYVIHAVGPVWKGGGQGEAGLLASAYRAALEEAARLDAKTLAFPAISTGVYGFPKQEAARIAVGTAAEFLREYAVPEEVRFVCFSEESAALHRKALEEVLGEPA